MVPKIIMILCQQHFLTFKINVNNNTNSKRYEYPAKLEFIHYSHKLSMSSFKHSQHLQTFFQHTTTKVQWVHNIVGHKNK